MRIHIYIHVRIYIFETCIFIHMGWLLLVGSIKLHVSFANEPFERDDILQKKHIILSILLTVATPYVYLCLYLNL